MKISERISKGWNAFRDKEQPFRVYEQQVTNYPAYRKGTKYSKRSIAGVVFNRIAADVAMLDFSHVKTSEDGQTQSIIKDGLHNCLTVEANIDQSYKEFINDIVVSMFDEGVIAVAPIDTSIKPKITLGFDIKTLRVGRITRWYPNKVTIDLYNDKKGIYEELTFNKKVVAIIQNPFYEIINNDNSTLKRLMKKMSEADKYDANLINDKLNIIVQPPYQTTTDIQQNRLQKSIDAFEEQLSKSKYGIGGFGSLEKITQLSQPITNSFSQQVKDLRQEFYDQTTFTKSVMDGTASETEMRNYYNRGVDVIATSIVAEFNRKFISKTARSQNHKITFYRDPFKIVPVEQLANIADTFTRNAILTPNEIRKLVGFGPSSDPKADELINRNIADVNQQTNLVNDTEYE